VPALSRSSSSVPAGAPRSSGEESSDEESEDEDEDGDVEVVIGPSHFAFTPLGASDLPLPDGRGGQVVMKSSAGAVCYSDVKRLTLVRRGPERQPLSFGSALHLNGHTDKCRPCLFERAPGRCRRLWLCDFCHMHEGRRHKVTAR